MKMIQAIIDDIVLFGGGGGGSHMGFYTWYKNRDSAN